MMTAPPKSWFDTMWATINSDIKSLEDSIKDENTVDYALTVKARHEFVQAFEYFYIAMGWN